MFCINFNYVKIIDFVSSLIFDGMNLLPLTPYRFNLNTDRINNYKYLFHLKLASVVSANNSNYFMLFFCNENEFGSDSWENNDSLSLVEGLDSRLTLKEGSLLLR